MLPAIVNKQIMKTYSVIIFVLLTVGTFGQQVFYKSFIKPDWDYADAVIERYDGNYFYDIVTRKNQTLGGKFIVN
jgi:hypothetical protein